MTQQYEYLGDGVYADFDGWAVILLTSDGVTQRNKIYLEPEVRTALVKFIEGLGK